MLSIFTKLFPITLQMLIAFLTTILIGLSSSNDLPQCVSRLHTTAKGPDYVTLQWTPSFHIGSPWISVISFREINQSSILHSIEIMHSNQENVTYKVSGLKARTKYTFNVSGKNKDGMLNCTKNSFNTTTATCHPFISSTCLKAINHIFSTSLPKGDFINKQVCSLVSRPLQKQDEIKRQSRQCSLLLKNMIDGCMKKEKVEIVPKYKKANTTNNLVILNTTCGNLKGCDGSWTTLKNTPPSDDFVTIIALSVVLALFILMSLCVGCCILYVKKGYRHRFKLTSPLDSAIEQRMPSDNDVGYTRINLESDIVSSSTSSDANSTTNRNHTPNDSKTGYSVVRNTKNKAEYPDLHVVPPCPFKQETVRIEGCAGPYQANEKETNSKPSNVTLIVSDLRNSNTGNSAARRSSIDSDGYSFLSNNDRSLSPEHTSIQESDYVQLYDVQEETEEEVPYSTPNTLDACMIMTC